MSPDPVGVLPEYPAAELTRPKGRRARDRPGRTQWRHRLPRPEPPARRQPPAPLPPATPGDRLAAARLLGEPGRHAGCEGLPGRHRVPREHRRPSAAGDGELAKKSRGDAGAGRLAPQPLPPGWADPWKSSDAVRGQRYHATDWRRRLAGEAGLRRLGVLLGLAIEGGA